MEIGDVTGIVIFSGAFIAYAFVLFGCMERKLKRLDRAVKQIEEENSKYVN